MWGWIQVWVVTTVVRKSLIASMTMSPINPIDDIRRSAGTTSPSSNLSSVAAPAAKSNDRGNFVKCPLFF